MNIFLVRRCLQWWVEFISGLQFHQRALDQGAGDWQFIAILGMNVRLFEEDVGRFGSSRLIELLSFQEAVGRLNLIRDIRDRAQNDSGMTEFVAIQFGGGGATDDGPIEI